LREIFLRFFLCFLQLARHSFSDGWPFRGY
jgi:hypothetical protein